MSVQDWPGQILFILEFLTQSIPAVRGWQLYLPASLVLPTEISYPKSCSVSVQDIGEISLVIDRGYYKVVVYFTFHWSRSRDDLGSLYTLRSHWSTIETVKG